MKLTKQKLREIIKEELSVMTEQRDQPPAPGLGNDVRFITIEAAPVGAEIEEFPQEEEEESRPSRELLTILRPLHASTEQFRDYLAANKVGLTYGEIRDHLLDSGLPESQAGEYALYGATDHSV